jgi:hypothetical protein
MRAEIDPNTSGYPRSSSRPTTDPRLRSWGGLELARTARRELAAIRSAALLADRVDAAGMLGVLEVRPLVARGEPRDVQQISDRLPRTLGHVAYLTA